MGSSAAWVTGVPPRPPRFPAARARALARDLAGVVRGEVRFDAGSRALYASDLSAYRQVPIGVVVPLDADDVVAAVEACRAHDAPVLGRGGGTSLGGQGCNAAVVIDFSKSMNRLLEVDEERRLARVQPGLVGMHLRTATADRGLTWAPDPATFEYCTLGGMIVNNSCGVHSTMLGMEGRSSDSVEELEILTYRGERLRIGRDGEGLPTGLRDKLVGLRDRHADRIRERYPKIPRRVSGYNLDDLLPEKGFHVARALAGTEGTCALVLEATVRLVDWPPARALVVLGYRDQFHAADHVLEILAHEPIGLEAVDSSVTENMKKLRFNLDAFALYPEGGAWLLAEFGGATADEAESRAQGLIHELARQRGGSTPTAKLFTDHGEQKQVWLVRESSIGVSRVPPDLETWSCFEDAAVGPERLGAYLRDFEKLLDRYGYHCVFFGHYGQGCVHSRITFDLKSAEGVRRFRAFMEEGSDLVLSYGGSLSGEHGDGQSHAELLPKMFGPELVEAFREFKAIWDPDFKLNPHKVVDPYPLDSNLRLGAAYRPRPVETHFRFPRDRGSFASATERCFGVGKCRRTEGGTMCPSFMVTREEMHTTRGRARLLFELLNGEVIGKRGWRDEHVKEALDLCLACKGCKGECPVGVDVATYKAEFLSHYYARRRRPASAYALGLFPVWASLASRAPRVANGVLAAPPVRAALVRLGGLSPQRPLPRFAPETFRTWFERRGRRAAGDRRVLLWPDTFTNHLDPEPGKAAVEVLEAAGYRVELPPRGLCCGRPLYDYGLLGRAKRELRRILAALAEPIAAGVPVVGLEPSCVAVFRDELVNLFPDDAAARRLSAQTSFLGEFLLREGYRPPALRGRAVVHGHCHHKALLKLADVEPLLARTGLDVEILDSGCCGLAGSFGYEAEHYDISMRIGERVLLPAVRDAPADALVVADGFSCRQQIAHGAGRRALHLAEVLRLALHDPTSSAG